MSVAPPMLSVLDPPRDGSRPESVRNHRPPFEGERLVVIPGPTAWQRSARVASNRRAGMVVW